MKTFQTTGDGPDGLWRTAEEREEGERALLRALAGELERALAGNRVRSTYIAWIIENQAAVREAYNRVRWEWAPVLRPSPHALMTVLRRLEGPAFRFNRRWSAEAHQRLWGFDPE